MPLDQQVCGFTADDFAQVVADLFPVGAVWSRDPDTVLMRTAAGMAVEFSRINARDCDLLAEAYPGTATETITDWERLLGLPDPCTGPLDTLAERRQAVLAKMSTLGGQSPQQIVEFLTRLGYWVQIIEGPGPYEWEVFTSPTTVRYFRAGESKAGDRLRSWGNLLLECAIERIRPAHTVVRIGYAIKAVWDGGNSIWDQGASVWDEHSPPPPGYVPPRQDKEAPQP